MPFGGNVQILKARRVILGAAVATVMLIGLTSGVASADPKSDDSITLTCPGQDPVDIVADSGNGQWTPGLDRASTSVYQPVGFADEYFVVRDGDGNVLEEGSDPGPSMKNGKRKGQTIVECTYLATFSGFDGELGMFIEGEFGGTVFVVQR